MALIKTAVGGRIYVWTEANKTKTKAVISAHGGGAWINGMDTHKTKGITLKFYSSHGHILSDPGLLPIISGKVRSMEDVAAGGSHDYSLSKYQNTNATSTQHNTSGETYTVVEKIDERFKNDIAKAQEALEILDKSDQILRTNSLYSQPKAVNERLIEQYGTFDLDLITVRSRNMMPSPKLSEIITALWAAGYRYTELHCSFCRGSGAAESPNSINLSVV